MVFRLCFVRLTKAVIGLGFAVFLSDGVAKGGLLYSNAAQGPATAIGLILGSGQLAGMRFQLSSSAVIDGVGGDLQVSSTIGTGSIFGALVQLQDMSDYPDSIDLSTPDVLATFVFSASADFTDVTIPIAPLTVHPGDYALVFGSDLFGATGEGSMSTDNPNFSDSSTFFYNTFDESWQEYGAGGGLRFTVYGAPVPEPSSAVLIAFLSVVLVLPRQLYRGLTTRWNQWSPPFQDWIEK